MGWAHKRSDCNEGQREAQGLCPGHSSWGRGEDEEPTTEPESWNSNHRMSLIRLQRLLEFQRTGIPYSQRVQLSCELLSWNGIKWRSNDLIAHVANKCTKGESTDAPRHSSKLWRLDAGMLSVVWGKEFGGPFSLLVVLAASVMSGWQTNAEHCFPSLSFKVKV